MYNGKISICFKKKTDENMYTNNHLDREKDKQRSKVGHQSVGISLAVLWHLAFSIFRISNFSLTKINYLCNFADAKKINYPIDKGQRRHIRLPIKRRCEFLFTSQ